jgi:transposase-like protein
MCDCISIIFISTLHIYKKCHRWLLSVFAFPAPLRKKLRTTNLIERCFVEVRRRTRPDGAL